MKRYKYKIDIDENGNGYISARWDADIYTHLPYDGYIDELPIDVQIDIYNHRLINDEWIKIEEEDGN